MVRDKLIALHGIRDNAVLRAVSNLKYTYDIVTRALFESIDYFNYGIIKCDDTLILVDRLLSQGVDFRRYLMYSPEHIIALDTIRNMGIDVVKLSDYKVERVANLITSCVDVNKRVIKLLLEDSSLEYGKFNLLMDAYRLGILNDRVVSDCIQHEVCRNKIVDYIELSSYGINKEILWDIVSSNNYTSKTVQINTYKRIDDNKISIGHLNKLLECEKGSKINKENIVCSLILLENNKEVISLSSTTVWDVLNKIYDIPYDKVENVLRLKHLDNFLDIVSNKWISLIGEISDGAVDKIAAMRVKLTDDMVDWLIDLGESQVDYMLEYSGACQLFIWQLENRVSLIKELSLAGMSLLKRLSKEELNKYLEESQREKFIESVQEIEKIYFMGYVAVRYDLIGLIEYTMTTGKVVDELKFYTTEELKIINSVVEPIGKENLQKLEDINKYFPVIVDNGVKRVDCEKLYRALSEYYIKHGLVETNLCKYANCLDLTKLDIKSLEDIERNDCKITRIGLLCLDNWGLDEDTKARIYDGVEGGLTMTEVNIMVRKCKHD